MALGNICDGSIIYQIFRSLKVLVTFLWSKTNRQTDEYVYMSLDYGVSYLCSFDTQTNRPVCVEWHSCNSTVSNKQTDESFHVPFQMHTFCIFL